MLNLLIGFLLTIGIIRPLSVLGTSTEVLPTPTPTVVPSPTPEPLVGFCERLPILMYHHTEPEAEVKTDGHANLNVTAEWFDKQMAYLKSRGTATLTITDVVTSLLNKNKLPGNSVVITADDGYDDIYQNAYPILQKYGLHMDLEIIAGLVGNKGYLTWDQLRQMQSSSLVHIYNHTWSHPSLASLKPDKVTSELSTAQTLLQQNLGVTNKIIIYPYGSFNNSVIAIAKNLGFAAGVSTLPGQIQCDSFLMALHRTRIGNAPLSTYGI